jgi:signal transduction histidine kinase/BarA-like signal transduction histidine kinase
MIKILIVDDYRENIEALSQLIPKEKVEIYSAMNANEALELVSRHEFSLALLDVQMPETTGFELADIIRGVKKFKTLPIIFVTAQPEDSNLIFKSYESGAVDLLFKPLDPNVVRAKVQTFVELAEQRNLLQTQVAELERLRVDAESANLAKSQFLANMSHEIRTPLAAVMGFAEIVSRGRSNHKEVEACSSAIKRNGDLLMRLIDDILDLSKIEANRLELQSMEFNLRELLQDVETTMSFRANENGVVLSFIFPEDSQRNYISDPVRLKQILLNVIGNAIKFNPQGRVRVEAELVEDTTSRIDRKLVDRLSVSVADDGVGLNPQQVDRLFQPFVQGDATTKRHFGGSGLGLYIARKIARATGGDVRLAKATPGSGATFMIELMLARASSSTLPKKAPEPQPLPCKDYFKGRKILAVDDSPDNLTLIDVFLEDSGASVTYAENGMRAIAEARKNNFDLILMDVQMPGMDGHETTEEIRRMNFDKPIVALTAHALKTEHDKCRQAGCDSVLTKPISRDKLVAHLRQYLPADASH